MRVCDYIAERLYEEGVRQVYGLVGGGTAGLNDGIFAHKHLEFVCFHHEQGAGHAAVGAARTNGKLAVVNVTTGCGGTNVMTSLLNAWQENMPVLFLSGNTRLNNMARTINKERGLELRRYGVQEHDIVTTVQNMTKYATIIESVNDVAQVFDYALHHARSGRPGPVWIDVPADIQAAPMPAEYKRHLFAGLQFDADREIAAAMEVFKAAKRPLVVAGAGISISDSQFLFRGFVEQNNIPFVTTFLTKDLIETDHPLNIGMIGIKGNRAANFAMQNADCLLIVGSSMNVTHIGYDAKSFSPHSTRIMVDIDNSELYKDIFRVDHKIRCDAGEFLNTAYPLVKGIDTNDWAARCLHWKEKWPIYRPEVHRPDTGGLNLYEICEAMNRHMQAKDTVIVDAGQPCYIWSTNGKYPAGSRYMAQAAQGDMGYAIPAVVGIHKTDPSLNLLAVIGEGSFMSNVQELATIAHHQVPVKIFVINNDGYMSIKQTQNKLFGGRQHGVSQGTGVNFPSIEKIAHAFGIDYINIRNNDELDYYMKQCMRAEKPYIVEIWSQHELDVQPAQAMKPNGTQGGLHDMSPFLSEQELATEMIVKI